MRKLSPLHQWIYAILGIICLFSCTQKAGKDQPTSDPWKASLFLRQIKAALYSEVDTSRTYNAIPSEVLPPIKAEYIDPSTLTPPIKVPLKGTPKVVPAHTNVKLAGTPKIIPIPKDVKSFTLGKEGVSLPKIVPAKSNIMPEKLIENLYKSTPVQAFRTKDEAIYNIQFLGLDQGLIAPDHSFILEDSRGDLWFGWQNNAIFRFDGKNLYHSMASSFDVMEDSKGNIWMAGALGLFCYNGQNFLRFPITGGMWTAGLKEDSKGNMWFGSTGGGVSRFDGHTFTKYNTEQEGAGSILRLTEDEMGRIWISSFNGKILRLHPETGQLARFDKGQSGITTIGKTKQLWIVGEGYAAKYDVQNDAFTINYQWEPGGRFWGGFQLTDDNHHNVWIGSRNRLTQIKKNGQAIQKDFPRVILGRGLPAATGGATGYQFPINSMHVDHKQRIWTAGEAGIFVGLDKLENLYGDSFY